jgi:ABC-type glycerol-3-phosphate transport system permease component
MGMGMVFIFPFLWMIFTSMKIPAEMASAHFKPFPTAPRTVQKTPYFHVDEDLQMQNLPDGIEKEVWSKAKQKIQETVAKKLQQWQAQFVAGSAVSISPDKIENYRKAMTEGCITLVSRKLSDKVRAVARKENNRLMGLAPGVVTRNELSPEAIDLASKAIADEAATLIDDALLQECFERVFKRICLGDIKLRIDNQIVVAPGNISWKSENSNASLSQMNSRSSIFYLAQIDFALGDQINVKKVIPNDGASKADRIYVGYRPDASWARLFFEVHKNGRIFRTREIVNCVDNLWTEAELRWEDNRTDMTARKGFFVLQDTGMASKSANPFEIRVVIEKSNFVMAWYDKILRNYRIVFREVPFARYFMTSVALCIINIILAIFSCTLTAYAFSRLNWPGRNLFFAIMIGTMMLPGQVLMIPGFLINRYLGFYNTLVPLWLYSTFGTAFFIFLLRQYMLTIPKSLEDSARIDGCGFLGIYWHVIMPLIKPTIATIAIFTFTGTWNNFMGALIYVNDERLFPLALGLFKFNLNSGTDAGLMMAGSFLMVLPVIILFFFAQNYFIKGIALTGTKE